MAPRTCSFRTAAAYHNLLALASIVLGVVMLVHAIRNLHNISAEDYTDGLRNAVRRIDFIDVAEGVVLLVFGLASLLAARKRCFGVTFRVVFLVSSFLVVGWLIFLFVSVLRELSAHKGAQALASFYGGAHNSTESETRICEVETTQHCRGLDDNDCNGCVAGSFNTTCTTFAHCVDCARFPQFGNASLPVADVGCRTLLVGELNSMFVRKLLVRGFLLVAVVIDIVLSCYFPVHVRELMVDEAPEEMEVTE